ncbi:recombinase family protein [Dickeya zeae]|uniref:recombinase family protein n=1 Tax=Dickeya zeae TaxID=204042 RepID=UPI00039F47A8|nr:recombinase family protein [Dickeya zeae]
MNQKIGYLRSFADNLNQREKLKSAGCTLIFEDKEKELPQLNACLVALNPGDVLVVTSLEILGRNMVGIVTTITAIARKKAFLVSMSEQLDSSQESGDALIRMCQLLMGCEQSLVREKNRKGLTASRARGRLGGRKMKLSREDISHIKVLLSHPESSVSDIAQKYGVSRTTIYKYVGVIVPDRAL